MVDMLNEMMSFSYAFYAVMLAFGLSMAFVVIYNTFTANVTERTREIASMRTIGEDGGHLATMITIENLMLAIVGIPLGVWLGLLVSQGLLDSMSTEAYTLEAILRPESVAIVVLLTLVVLLVSEIPPARRIFKLDLAEATKMRE
jgi:putative ABC transport system permease protein